MFLAGGLGPPLSVCRVGATPLWLAGGASRFDRSQPRSRFWCQPRDLLQGPQTRPRNQPFKTRASPTEKFVHNLAHLLVSETETARKIFNFQDPLQPQLSIFNFPVFAFLVFASLAKLCKDPTFKAPFNLNSPSSLSRDKPTPPINPSTAYPVHHFTTWLSGDQQQPCQRASFTCQSRSDS